MASITTAARIDPASAGGALRRMPTQARSRDKVGRALDAAQALLEREGVDAVTLPRVAEEAGVSVGALYQYLPDREAIVGALSTVYHARLESLMDDLLERRSVDRTDDPVGAVVAAVAEVYRGQSGTRALRAGLQSGAQMRMTREHKDRMVAKVHALLTGYDLVAADAPAVVARTVFFAADGLMHEAFAHRAQGDPGLIAEIEVLLRAYLGAASGADGR